VLVTGARGFIAAHLCERLMASGAIVYGVSSRSGLEHREGLTWLHGDLADRSVMTSVIQRSQPDVVFHLAGHVSGAQGAEQVEPTFAANLVSTVHLLNETASRNCRVVLTGSMQEPDRPGDPPIPCSPYAASKWAAGAYARMFHALYGLQVVIGRPMMVYGPGQWDRAKLLPYLATSLLTGESPAVSTGTRELDWVYVTDVVDGLMTLARASNVCGLTIDLGSGTLTSIRAIAEQVGAIVGSQTPIRFGAVPDRPLERPRAARAEETYALIGWRATTMLDEGLRQTVAWYRDQCCSPKPV
jgi:nucleoside-diphosphate-sugar epimerase